MQGTHVGFRFVPTDEELLFYYLQRKVNGESLPSDVVTDCNIYGGKEPWKIFDKNSNETFYVFSKLRKKSKLRIERTVGCGTWKGQNSTKIMDCEKLVGSKEMFIFEAREKAMAVNGHWIMHEFSLAKEKVSFMYVHLFLHALFNYLRFN